MLIVAFIQMGVEGDELRRMRPVHPCDSLFPPASPPVFSLVPARRGWLGKKRFERTSISGERLIIESESDFAALDGETFYLREPRHC